MSRQRHPRPDPALLRGLIFAPGGHAMTPSHSRKAGKLYRYYVATDAIRLGHADCPMRSVPAAEVEEAVVSQVTVAARSSLHPMAEMHGPRRGDGPTMR